MPRRVERHVRLGLVLATIVCAGCIGPGNRQTLRFDLAPGPVGTQVTERHWYVLWGLVPTVHENALRRCPAGVVAIRESPGEMGALAWLPTFGIASRSITYLCRAETETAPP